MTYPYAKTWDRFANSYAKRSVPDQTVYEKKLAKTQEYFHADSHVLELGCGTGTTALIHAEHVNHILATDFSAKMIRIAQDKAAQKNITNVTFEQRSVTDIQLDAEAFDVLMAHSLLHLVEDPNAVIKLAMQVLKPGGFFVQSTPCLTGSMKLFSYIAPIASKLGLLPLIKLFPRHELDTMMDNAGFVTKYEWQPEGSASVFLISQKPQSN